MARSFIAGLLAGIVMSGIGLGAASVMAPPPDRGAPAAALPDVPAGSGFNQGREDAPAELPDMARTPTKMGEAAPVAAPEPDALVLDAGGAAPAAQPEVGAAQADLSAPQVATESGMVVQQDSPLMAAPDAAQPPEAALPESDLSISAEPVQPALPEAEEEAFPAAEEAAPVEEAVARQEIAEAPEEDLPEVQDTAPEDEIAARVPAPVEPPEAEQPAPEENTSTIGNLAEEVETGRLPSVGDREPAPDAAGEAGATTEAQTAPRPAIEAFAAPFENPEGKPLMSIILIDDGTSPIGVEALASFPYPLTFAVDAAAPGAAGKMRIYRDKGFEVMALANLPEGAQAVDAEVTMQTVLSAVPEAVAILEGTSTGLQRGRDVSEQLASILTESGHGLVLFSGGLDTAQKLISREGVPVGAVFRDFDSAGQDAKVIRRFLDQAAFKASREDGGVIMLGRLRADTISALLLWGLQDRASSVALAPISAVLISGGDLGGQ